ncbi:DUF4389 domain-containing protein [Aestuariirhabdus litorea]|uniref:DUF4389 domain-containing protein n=2 Tax=Aestuariirhabdus litorea TaxID=2528527 RepID=A0A3P3VV33_9GAMM|nr:DUF4389 domain-containing protein [Aestuariirhabdus litorea]RWW98695.1 DUF4389 domain-containing protein [Endozoicomonadaceae bacterium GTF-13]
MLLFWLVMQLTRLVVGVVVLSQVVFVLMTGSPNDNLLDFSRSLNRYIFQILQFLTYHSEQKPFPFSDWPQA